MFFVLCCWWLAIGGRHGDGVFEYCLLIIIKAVVVAEIGVLWSLGDGIKIDGEGELLISNKPLNELRWSCDWRDVEHFDERWRSAWDWERPRRTLADRNFVTIVEEDKLVVQLNVWRIWLELVKFDIYINTHTHI